MSGENTYTLKLIIEAVNKVGPVLQDVKARLDTLDQQVKQAGALMGQGGDAVRQKFDEIGKGITAVQGVVQHSANAIGAAAQNVEAQTVSPVDRIKAGFTNLKNEVAQLPHGIGSMVTGFMGAYAAMASVDFVIRKVTSTVQEALAKFSDLKLVGLQLEAAWEGTGRKMPVDRLRQYTDAIAENSLFSKKSVETAAKNLSIYTAISDEQLPRVLKVASMMAAFKGGEMGIEEAAQLLGRASTGMVGSLTRLGFPLSAAAKQSKDFEVILGDLEKKLGGALPAVMSTWNAQLQLLEKSHSKLKTALGEFLTPAIQPAMAAHVQSVEQWSNAIKGTLQDGKLNEVQKWLKDMAFIVKAMGDALKDAVAAWARFQVAMRGPTGGGGEGQEKQEETWLQWANRITQVVGEKIFPAGIMAKWMRERGQAAQKAFEEGMGEGKKGTGISDMFSEGGIPKGPSSVVTQIREAQDEATKFRKEMEGVELLHPEDKQAFKEFFDESDRWLKILEAIHQGLATAGETAQKVVKIDWDSEIKKAEAYFSRQDEISKLAFEGRKSLVWEEAASKEQAEARISELEISNSLRRVQQAQSEHATMIAFQREQFAAKEEELRKRLGADEEGFEEQKKHLTAQRIEAEIGLEKKLTQVIIEEINQRRQALQKAEQERLELSLKIVDEAHATQKALESVNQAAMSEADKFKSKYQEAMDTFKRALAELPNAPEKAMELAKQARQAFEALHQDVFALQKNLQDTRHLFRDLEIQISMAGLTGVQKRQAEINQVQQLIADARELRQQGLLQESENAFKEAARKAASLATTTEGVPIEQAKAEARALLDQIKGEAMAVAKDRLQEAKERNEAIKAKIIEAGKAVADALELKMKTVVTSIEKLTAAIQNLTASFTAQKTFTPSQEAEQKAQASAGAGGEAAGGAPSANRYSGATTVAGVPAATSPETPGSAAPSTARGTTGTVGATIGTDSGIERAVEQARKWVKDIQTRMNNFRDFIGEATARARTVLVQSGQEFGALGRITKTLTGLTTEQIVAIGKALENEFGRAMEALHAARLDEKWSTDKATVQKNLEDQGPGAHVITDPREAALWSSTSRGQYEGVTSILDDLISSFADPVRDAFAGIGDKFQDVGDSFLASIKGPREQLQAAAATGSAGQIDASGFDQTVDRMDKVAGIFQQAAEMDKATAEKE